jgi:hypothetical protein
MRPRSSSGTGRDAETAAIAAKEGAQGDGDGRDDVLVQGLLGEDLLGELLAEEGGSLAGICCR